MTPWTDPFFPEHGVLPEVAAARPYVRWTPDDLEPIRAAYGSLGRYQLQYMLGLARQAPGRVITRHAPPGLDLPHVYAEVRPDKAVRTGPPTKHYHGDPEMAPSPDLLSERRVFTPNQLRKHVDCTRAPADHHGRNTNEVHYHEAEAKYVFPPSGKIDRPYWHDHSRFRGEERRQAHVERSHGGSDTDERHEHVTRVKDPTDSLAMRLDVHPLAVDKLATAETVFFVIEGCIKADAVLSAGAAVFSVPSVTLWDAEELPSFVWKYLVGRRVIIVPDADWTKNGAVITQARLCQTRLWRLGVSAVHVAAPPVEAGHKGVDDFLAAGGTLAGLDVIDREPPTGLSSRLPGRRRDQLRRNVDVLEALALHADTGGEISCSLRAVARIMEKDVKRVARAVVDLAALGAITIEGDLAMERNWFSRDLAWRDRPTITVHPDLRALDLPPRPLGVAA